MTKQKVSFLKYVTFVTVCLFVLFALVGTMKSSAVSASEASTFSYYGQLNDTAKKFYNAIDKMNTEGMLESGNQKFDLLKNKVLTEKQVKDFENGSSQLLKDFGAGKDAYYLDHPEVFYINFDCLALSFAVQSGKYIANIDAGRYANYYIENGFQNKADVLNAKTQYNSALTAFNNQISNLESSAEKVKRANELLSEAITYSFCADNASEASAIRTAYGAVVNGKAVCEGYARAFKAVMDKQNIECVIVVGYFYDDDGQLEPHAWNNVRLDGKWYLVDCTMNDSASDVNKYTLIGNDSAVEYKADGVISSSNFEFEYPVLATYDYGMEELQTQVNYENSTISVKLDGKNALELQSEGVYILCAHETDEGWSNYYALAVQNLTDAYFNVHCLSTKFIATKQAPVEGSQGIYTSIDESQIVAKSDIFYNELYDVTAYSPNVRTATPSNTAVLDAGNTYSISIEYDVELKKVDESKAVGIRIYSEKDSELQNYVTVEDVVFDGAKKVSFKLTPSKMYKHDTVSYHITPTNLVSKSNDATPRSVSYVFAKPWSVCSKVYDNGRLYMNVYGEPTLIDNQDLSISGFVDKDGKQIAEGQRSQLVMVATKPDSETAEDMLSSSLEVAGVNKGDVKASATYELDLHVCGVVQQIPEGSYLKLAFGFPEGYGPEDKGTTFKVYHFKRGADGKIDPALTEEIPCVVTEYGLVVVVDSFSPFMVMAVDSKKVESQTKSVYTYVANLGGNVVAKVGDEIVSDVVTLSENQKIEYSLVPQDGMQVDFVLLNKQMIEVKDNKFVVDYKDLQANNQIQIAFVASSVADYERNNKIENLNAKFMANETVGATSPLISAGVIVAIILVVAVIIAGAVFAIVYCRKSRTLSKPQE